MDLQSRAAAILMRNGLVALAITAVSSSSVLAEIIEIPTQNGWQAARQTVNLPSGQTVGYVEMGDTTGKPLVLIHGYTDNSRSWSLLAPELAGHHIYAVDLRGHGKSSAPECCYTLMDFTADLDGFMQAKGIKKADLVGHSLGSMTAAVYTAQHPERVDKLVLISTAAFVPKAGSDWLWDNVPKLTPPLDPNGTFMTEWYANPHPVPADFLDREKVESAAIPLQVWNGVLSGLTMTDWSPYAARITAPTLIIWGDKDGLFDAGSQDHIKSIFPKARHETFAGYGHNAFWEAPKEVGAMIQGFLAQ